MSTRRAGAALILAIVIVAVIQCLVVGTLHLAMQEHRLASNGATALRLRLAAETALRTAPEQWRSALDSLSVGAADSVHSAVSTDGIARSAMVVRIDSALYLITGTAAEPLPRSGRAAAAGLFLPPLLPSGDMPHAALAVAGRVTVRAGAHVSAWNAQPCAPGAAIQFADSTFLNVDPTATLLGDIVTAPLPDVPFIVRSARLRTDSAATAAVTAIHGDLHLGQGERLAGLILVHGSLAIDAAAEIRGVAIVTGDADIGGSVFYDPCLALAAARSARLDRPRPHTRRPVVPAFW